MDIRQWLDTTVDRASPTEDEHHGIADFFQKRHEDQAGEDVRPQYRRKRKRPSSDSSLIQTRQYDRERREHDKSSAGEIRGVAHAVTISSRSQTSRSSASSESIEPPPKTYEKRARHKTRPDRYEHKPKKPRKRREARAGDKKSKRRKSHRSGDGGRTTGLVESFQLTNGPKKNRLTVSGRLSCSLRGTVRADLPSAETQCEWWTLQAWTRFGAGHWPWRRM